MYLSIYIYIYTISRIVVRTFPQIILKLFEELIVEEDVCFGFFESGPLDGIFQTLSLESPKRPALPCSPRPRRASTTGRRLCLVPQSWLLHLLLIHICTLRPRAQHTCSCGKKAGSFAETSKTNDAGKESDTPGAKRRATLGIIQYDIDM